MFQADIIENFWSSGLWQAIKYTGLGMLGIFIVTALIILTIYVLGKVTDIEINTEKEENE